MSYRIVLVTLALLLAGTNCYSQVSIAPQSPTILDAIYVHLPLTKAFSPESTQVSMASNKITIAFNSINLDPTPPGLFTLNWPLGSLPAGTYQVEVQEDQAVIASTQFTVLARPATGPLRNNTDMWWNSSESGWGASFVQHGSGNIFGVFFIYAANGTATWYVLPGGHWTSGLEFTGDVYQTKGPVLAGFDPSLVTTTRIGAATIDFDVDPNKASLILTIDGQTIQKAITRMSY